MYARRRSSAFLRSPSALSLGRRLLHRADRDAHHLVIEPALAREVIVHRGDVGVRGAADVADGDVRVAMVGKETGCRGKETLACFDVLVRGTHRVRLNSSVAAVIATVEKTSRYSRSVVTASSPVFLSSRLLNAWTA